MGKARRKTFNYARVRRQIGTWYGAARGAYQVGRHIYNQASGNSLGSKVGRRMVTAPPTTNQTNIRTTYKKKPLPSAVKKRARKRYKRFRHMQFRAIGVAHQVYRWAERVTTADDKQGMNVLCLRGANGTFEKEFHLKALADNMVTSTSTSQQQYKGMSYLYNSVMDYQIRNSSDQVVICDMYHFVCKKDLPKEDAAISGSTDREIKNMLIRCKDLNFPSYTDTTGAQTNATIDEIGITPFQCPDFCQYFTITKKEHLQLNANQISTGQIKSQKRLFYSTDLVENLNAMKGQTMGVVFVFRSTFDGDPTVLDYPGVDLDFSAQWTYALKRTARNMDSLYRDPTLTN